MPAPKKHPDELRERAVRLVLESGRPIAHIAKDLGIHRDALRQWVRQAEADTGSRRDRLTAEERERLKSLERENRELRKANEILKAASVFVAKELDPTRPKRAASSMSFAAASGSSSSARPWACRRPRTTSVPRASAQPASARTSGCWSASARSHEANFEAYGHRRTWKALLRAGERVPRCQVQRLMRQAGIQGAKRRGKPWRTTVPDPSATRPADLVERDFSAEAPDRLWVCDLTRLRCGDGVRYFAFVIDVDSRRVVGWQLATHMRTTLVLDALRMALTQRRPGADVRLVVHSDAGSQYTSFDYTQVLDDHDVQQSIGSVGDALDNALAESFVDSF